MEDQKEKIEDKKNLDDKKTLSENNDKTADLAQEKKDNNKDANVKEINKKEKKASGDLSKPKKKKGKIRRQVQKGRAYINSTYNNTVISMTDMHGNILAWSTSGLLGFKGAKKATTYAANQVVLDITEKISRYGLKDLEVFIKGVGSGREAAIRALAQKGFNINSIKDRTPIPHNGCRARKPRRV